MVGDLPVDVVGTNPKHQPLVDHTWLDVDVNAYDNFPSDNNPVRVQDKLSQLWNPDLQQKGVKLIPNAPSMSAPCCAPHMASSEIVREAKKAMMAGEHGRGLAEYLRARFAKEDLAAAKEELAKVASEQGLLGNVYIDASAFHNAQEAEEYFSKHRGRLAQDIVVAESKINADTIKVLANRFRKNVVAAVTYDAGMFAKYKDHLVASGRIASDFVVDSKETLREAFLAAPKKPLIPSEAAPATSAAPMAPEQEQGALQASADAKMASNRLAMDEMEFKNTRGIVAFAREQMAKGKTGSDLKAMLRDKFLADDLKIAAKYLAVVVSDARVASLDKLVEAGRISESAARGIAKIAKDNPLPTPSEYVEEEQSAKPAGVQATYHVMQPRQESTGVNKQAVDSLCAGKSPDAVFADLCKEMPRVKAMDVLTASMSEFNSMPAGKKANTFTPAPKQKLVEDAPEKVTLPDPATIAVAAQEYADFYAGATGDIPVDPVVKRASPLDIGDMFNRSGMDSVL